jgi:hypothetical protein
VRPRIERTGAAAALVALAGHRLAAAGGTGARQWHLWSQQSRIDTDILALLPQDAHDRLLSDVTRRIADGSSRQVVVLLGSRDGAAAKRAQAAFAAAMARTPISPAGAQRLDRRLVR